MSKGIREDQRRNSAVTLSGNTENDEEKMDNMDQVYTCMENLTPHILRKPRWARSGLHIQKRDH